MHKKVDYQIMLAASISQTNISNTNRKKKKRESKMNMFKWEETRGFFKETSRSFNIQKRLTKKKMKARAMHVLAMENEYTRDD